MLRTKIELAAGRVCVQILFDVQMVSEAAALAPLGCEEFECPNKPFETPQIPFNRDNKGLNRGTLGF